MILTDTHTHFYYESFLNDIETHIQEAKEAHVSRFFMPNIDSSTYNPMLKLSKTFPELCFPMAGLHPVSVKEDFKQQLAITETFLKQETFYAIGEIGIDLYHDKAYINQQKEAFHYQIELAKTHNLPIVIHCRDAFTEVMDILKEHEVKKQAIKGIFHCFSGTIEHAQKIIEDTNFFLGIGGIVTFKNAGLDKVVESIDLKHLVLETDAPYLAPTPFRGKTNSSKYIMLIAQKIAELKQTHLEKVAQITTINSKTVFGV